MDKQIVVYAYNGTLLSNKKEWTIDIDLRTWMDLKGIMLSEKCQSPKVMYFMIPYGILDVTELQW